MSEEIKNRSVKPDRLQDPDDRLNRRNTFAWILWGLLVPIAFLGIIWVFWLFELIG